MDGWARPGGRDLRVILVLVPDAVGRQLLGDSWSGASRLIWPLWALAVLRVLVSGIAVVMRARGQLVKLRNLTIVVATLGVALALIGGLVWGEEALVWSLPFRSALTLVALLLMADLGRPKAHAVL